MYSQLRLRLKEVEIFELVAQWQWRNKLACTSDIIESRLLKLGPDNDETGGRGNTHDTVIGEGVCAGTLYKLPRACKPPGAAVINLMRMQSL